MNKRILKNVGLGFIAFLMIMIIVVGCYLEYVILQYYRIDDEIQLDIIDNSNGALALNKTYTVSTYNIGFGAYDQEYSFFMDEGYMKDGTYVSGKYAKARSKDIVLKNTNGSISTIKNLDVDFAFFQEVDKEAHRSYKVNQYEMILDEFNNYDTSYASNFHSANLLYPFNDISHITKPSKYLKYDFKSNGITILGTFFLSNNSFLTVIPASLYIDIPPIRIFSLISLVFTNLFKTTLAFELSNIPLSVNCLKKAVSGCIVNISIDCTK